LLDRDDQNSRHRRQRSAKPKGQRIDLFDRDSERLRGFSIKLRCAHHKTDFGP